MCRFASFILTKDREFWSINSDSHEDIIAEHALVEDGVRGPNILRVEIIPTPNIMRFDDFEAWQYKIDQDIVPEWHDAAVDEERTRRALLLRATEGFLMVDARGCASLRSLSAPMAVHVETYDCVGLITPEKKRAK